MTRRAMLLAAGLGTRMRPLTDRMPKPLLPLGRKALIDHALDRLEEAGVETVVVNAHWQADQLAGYLARRSRPRTVLLREPALLDTGGSVKAALSLLGTEPFFVVNGRRVLARRDAARTAAPGRCLRSGERGWRAAGAPNLSGPRGGRPRRLLARRLGHITSPAGARGGPV